MSATLLAVCPQPLVGFTIYHVFINPPTGAQWLTNYTVQIHIMVSSSQSGDLKYKLHSLEVKTMFGIRRSTTIQPYTWRDIPNDIVASRARDSGWSIGKVQQAVRAESMNILATLAVSLKCEITEVKCERCDFPLITAEELANGVIVHVERIAPNGYVAHPASQNCETRTIAGVVAVSSLEAKARAKAIENADKSAQSVQKSKADRLKG